jgi:hypothetical protein
MSGWFAYLFLGFTNYPIAILILIFVLFILPMFFF